MLLSGHPLHTAQQILPLTPLLALRSEASQSFMRKKYKKVSLFVSPLQTHPCAHEGTYTKTYLQYESALYLCEFLKSNKAVLCPADKRPVYQRGRPLHKYVGSSYYKLCPWQRTNSWGKKCYMAGVDKGHFQPGWSDTSPWAVLVKAVYLTHRRERESERKRERRRERWHSKPPALTPSSLSLYLMTKIKPWNNILNAEEGSSITPWYSSLASTCFIHHLPSMRCLVLQWLTFMHVWINMQTCIHLSLTLSFSDLEWRWMERAEATCLVLVTLTFSWLKTNDFFRD